MPVSRQVAEQLAQQVTDLYRSAEQRMLERIASNLKKGLDRPQWAAEKLAQMRAYRRQTQALIKDLEAEARTGVQTALTEAYDRGGLAAVQDAQRIAGKGALAAGKVEPLAGLQAVEKLVQETMGYLHATGPRILGSTMQAYQGAVAAGHTAELEQSVAEGIAQVRLGAATRIQGSQTVLDNFAKHGITGLVDKAGRGWDLATYAEMAVRAGTTNAAVAGHLDTLLANDLPLVIVSEDGAPCPECVDWEGQILSIEPGNPEYDSVDDAMGAGLFHPGCKHDVSAYQEGYTREYPVKSEEDLAGEAQLYQDNQKLRGIEREIRKSKRMEAVSLDDAGKMKAHARVLKYQAQAREHVASTESLRQYARESITRSGGRGVAAAESTAAKTVTAATVSPVGVAAVDSRALETARGIFKGREQRIAGVDHQMSGAVYHPDTRRINVQSGKYLGRLAEESSDPVVVRQAMHEGGTFLHETIHGTGTGFATRAEWKFYGTREGRVLEEGLTESLARRTLPEFMGSMFPTLDEAVLTARRLGSYDDYVSAIDSVADYVATFGQRTATGFVEELANGTVPMRRIDRMAEIILADAKLPADLKGPLSDLITQEVTRVGKAYRDAPPRDIGAAVRQAVEATRRELEAKP